MRSAMFTGAPSPGHIQLRSSRIDQCSLSLRPRDRRASPNREQTPDDFVVTFADAMEPSQTRVPRPGGRLYPSALTVDLTVDTLIVDVTVDTLIVDVTVDMDAAG